MAKRKEHLELLCLICSGGDRDTNGAYTVCAICELAGAAIPEPLVTAQAA